ncbi:MAG TPA: hypothetical protein PKW55_02580 [Spirochaetota bacterium]|nr:hypothetical protein [Spirochaetota bacterium]HOM38265.1 hypothetical protein [Spirochaetota bacterium]HPQ48517.1 hypothetical protein [Spirochaetota bacterium]
MKKIITILITILSINLFAQEAKEVKKEDNPFKFTGQAYAYTATYNTTKKDEKMTFSAYRFRPYFSYIKENVEATLKLEFDQFFGNGANEKYVKVGADTKNVVEVKAAYLLFNNVLAEGVFIKGGVDDYKTPGGFIVGTDVALGILGYKWEKNYISAVYVKIEESNEKYNGDDAQMYGIDMSLTLPIITIRPAIYLIQGGKDITNKPWADSTAILPALTLSLKIDNIETVISGTYATGKDKDANIKYSGYATDIFVGYSIDKEIKIGGFFTMLSGDNPDTTDKKEGFASFQLKHDGFGRMFLLENQQTFSNIAADTFADIRMKTQGYMLFGITGSAKFNIIDVKFNIGYANLMKETSATKTKKDLGFEADLSIGLEVQKNAKIVLDLAYLNTGKAFGTEGFGTNDTQNSMYTGLGMTLKF